MEYAIYTYGSGLITGLILGLTIFVIFKKDFWTVASAFYRKHVGEVGLLQSEVVTLKAKITKQQNIIEGAHWYKRKGEYDKKFEELQEKTWKAQKQLEKNSQDREEIELSHKYMMEAHDSLHRRVDDFNRNIAWMVRDYE